MILTDKEYELLELLYFTHTFQALLVESTMIADDLEAELQSLLTKELVHQMFFDEHSKDYVMQDTPDRARLRDAAYVISKKGLLQHNSR